VTKIKCPGCDLELEEDELREQVVHMDAEHPEIVAQRRAESAAWDGWVND
jgi:hypothetical protein